MTKAKKSHHPAPFLRRNRYKVIIDLLRLFVTKTKVGYLR